MKDEGALVVLFVLSICAGLSLAVALLSEAYKHDLLKQECVKHGYAEWVADEPGEMPDTFRLIVPEGESTP